MEALPFQGRSGTKAKQDQGCTELTQTHGTGAH
jgi:hypothetical protein